MASRYNSFDSRASTTSSYFSDPSSSAEALTFTRPSTTTTPSSRALVKSKPKIKSNEHNLTTMVKKFMDKKSTSSASPGFASKGSSKKPVGLVIPSDLIAEDLKKTARKGSTFMGLQKKLFGKENKKEVRALTEAKGTYSNGNTRTLAMVLRSERELLNANKDHELEIAQLKSMLEDKNREVEKLKDLCLKQREEIKSLKNAVLFPDVMNSQFQEILVKQGSELNQAKQLIPNLQRQVASLTGQLQCLAEDLAEVKADKYGRACIQFNGTPSYEHEESANSLELSSCDGSTPDSPDDLLLKDLNPCLTPFCTKTKSKECDTTGYDSSFDETISENNTQMSNDHSFECRLGKLSESSDSCRFKVWMHNHKNSSSSSSLTTQ